MRARWTFPLVALLTGCNPIFGLDELKGPQVTEEAGDDGVETSLPADSTIPDASSDDSALSDARSDATTTNDAAADTATSDATTGDATSADSATDSATAADTQLPDSAGGTDTASKPDVATKPDVGGDTKALTLPCGSSLCDHLTEFCCITPAGETCLTNGTTCSGGSHECASEGDCSGLYFCCLQGGDPAVHDAICVVDGCSTGGKRRLCTTIDDCDTGSISCSPLSHGVSYCF